MKIRPNTIDLFAGAGGFSLGFKNAGFKIIGAIEVNKVYASTHEQNFSDARTIIGDIRQWSPSRFAEETGITRKDVDVLIGGPPCQTFSTIGSAKINSISGGNLNKDHRNYLFRNFYDYVEYFKPKAFVMENVPTMGTKDKGRLFDDIIARIIQLEYTPRFSILNAVNFGVPQTRKRLFIVGIRNERRQFEFPKETHCSLEDQEKISCLKRFTTVDDAISDLPKIHDGIREHHLPYSQVNPITEYQKQLRRGQTVVGNNVCRMSNERAKKIFSFMEQGAKYMDLDPEIRKILPFREDIFHDRLKRLSLNKPSWTVLAHIGMDGYMYIHPTDDRTLSVREAARIQSFDDCFEFMGNMREQYVQVGNSVPPLLAKKIAESIQKTLNGKG